MSSSKKVSRRNFLKTGPIGATGFLLLENVVTAAGVTVSKLVPSSFGLANATNRTFSIYASYIPGYFSLKNSVRRSIQSMLDSFSRAFRKITNISGDNIFIYDDSTTNHFSVKCFFSLDTVCFSPEFFTC